MSQQRRKEKGPIGGLGVRYGVKAKKRYGEVLMEKNRRHFCPQCSSNSVRRESVGVWICKKCGFKFTGGAYIPVTKIGDTAERSARTR